MVLGMVLNIEMVLTVYLTKNGLDSFSLSNPGLWLIPITILDSLGSIKGIILLVCGSDMVKLLRSLAFLKLCLVFGISFVQLH
jgi:hypothetical protein